MNAINLKNRYKTHLWTGTSDIIVEAISDVGCLRTINEDQIWIHDSGKVLLLADGMGGHERGSDASRIALETLSSMLSPESNNNQLENITIPENISSKFAPVYGAIYSAVKKTAKVMAERNRELNLSKYMGTTITGLITEKKHVFWFHVGDSRVYRLREGKLKCLTVDHSVYEVWKKAGSIGEAPAKNLVTRVIGNNPEVEADINWEIRKKGDIYLLCSDGLSDMLPDAEIEDILNVERSIHATAEMLISEALSAGGRDNVSIILCKII